MTPEITIFALLIALISLVVAVVALWWVGNLSETVERKEKYQLRENRCLVDGLQALSHKHDRLVKALGLVSTEQPRYVKDSK